MTSDDQAVLAAHAPAAPRLEGGPDHDETLNTLRSGGSYSRSETLVRFWLKAITVAAAAFVLLVAFYVLREGLPTLIRQGTGFVFAAAGTTISPLRGRTRRSPASERAP